MNMLAGSAATRTTMDGTMPIAGKYEISSSNRCLAFSWLLEELLTKIKVAPYLTIVIGMLKWLHTNVCFVTLFRLAPGSCGRVG